MIIVTSVKKETVVGIMIVHQLLYTVDTEVENPLNHINEESIEVGNTTEKLNGSSFRSLGVTDSTKHYGCFGEGSNPSETSMFTKY